jgi:hypothetical protein
MNRGDPIIPSVSPPPGVGVATKRDWLSKKRSPREENTKSPEKK